jgi:tricorn protease
MHLANITPNTAYSNDASPAMSPDGWKVAFASDRDGNFEIYIADVFTGEVQRVTDNAQPKARLVS